MQPDELKAIMDYLNTRIRKDMIMVAKPIATDATATTWMVAEKEFFSAFTIRFDMK